MPKHHKTSEPKNLTEKLESLSSNINTFHQAVENITYHVSGKEHVAAHAKEMQHQFTNEINRSKKLALQITDLIKDKNPTNMPEIETTIDSINNIFNQINKAIEDTKLLAIPELIDQAHQELSSIKKTFKSSAPAIKLIGELVDTTKALFSVLEKDIKNMFMFTAHHHKHSELKAHKMGEHLQNVRSEKPQTKPMGVTHRTQNKPPRPTPFK